MEYLDVSVDMQTSLDFSSLNLPIALVRVLRRQGITEPTPVQSAVVPDALAGRDVLGRARTGSGKTLAFGLPILARLAGSRSRPKSPRALIIVPTRELANQVRTAIEPLAVSVQLRVATVYGGMPYDQQIRKLRGGVDVIVATPGRLDDLIKRGACRLDQVESTVLDEADHLCDLGFYPAVDALLHQTPAGGQRLLLSATLDGDVDRLVRTHLSNPVRHEVDAAEEHRSEVAHHVLVTDLTSKYRTTSALLVANPRSIVFTRTRRGATRLAKQLRDSNVDAVDLHGNLTQRARERNLRKFSTGQVSVVVATDVAARGIHVDNVAMVVHYDLPTEAKAFMHRSGRTARAGVSGAVVTIATQGEVGQVVRLHNSAGVDARHHDDRSAPQPMSVESLGKSGVAAPTIEPARRKSAGGRTPARGRTAGAQAGGAKSTVVQPRRWTGHGRRTAHASSRPRPRSIR
jgi:superfamily II DNA/RNA helicase